MDSTGCCVVVVLIVACVIGYAVWSRGRASNRVDEALRPGVDDARWLREGEARYQGLVGRHYGSPETIAEGGIQRLQANDRAAALFFFQKAIDLLHTNYLFDEMRQRRPSDHDLPIIGAYLDTLGAIRADRPTTPVGASVQEVTHRLRTIATACQDAGIDPSRYLTALTSLAEIAPDIDASGTFRRNPTMDELLRGDDETDRG
jgi:hypothetical protein